MKLETDFKKYKDKTSVIFNKLDNSKLKTKLKDCASYVLTNVYQHNQTKDLKTTKESSFLCKHKFCYVCEAIKNNKYRYGLKEKLFECVENKNYIDFLTLTIPNCNLEDLNTTLSNMNEKYNSFLTNFKKTYGAIGTFKRVEITYKRNHDNFKPIIECHPHFHILVVYEKLDKINNPDFNLYKDKWKSLTGGSVFVKSFKTKNLSKSINELTKYITKEDNFDIMNKEELVSLNRQLKGKRFFSKTGILNFKMKEVKNSMEVELDKKLEELDKNFIKLFTMSFGYKNFGAKNGFYFLNNIDFEKSNYTIEELEIIYNKLLVMGEISIETYRYLNQKE